MWRNYYSEINLHMTWHVKESAPLLVPKIEAILHHYLRGRCINTPGAFMHEIGGIETHVHLCVSGTCPFHSLPKSKSTTQQPRTCSAGLRQ
ncbi:MAG TPA: hypothetical protein VKE98_02745 [Gemmataceae bacterium]|nr:hypothetical protein [Gemmataceae bacterium]